MITLLVPLRHLIPESQDFFSPDGNRFQIRTVLKRFYPYNFSRWKDDFILKTKRAFFLWKILFVHTKNSGLNKNGQGLNPSNIVFDLKWLSLLNPSNIVFDLRWLSLSYFVYKTWSFLPSFSLSASSWLGSNLATLKMSPILSWTIKICVILDLLRICERSNRIKLVKLAL